ncbi:MAG: polysaccharide deacetylase family protein [Bacillota bacterium]
MKRLTFVLILAWLFLIPVQDAEARQNFYEDKVVVLLYHDISDSRKNSATIPPELFREHMAVLEQHFNVVSLDDVVAFQNGQKSIPPNAVAITFDDGYRSNYEVAYPILKQYGWPATVFLTVDNIGRVTAAIENLTWGQISEMAANGFSFGSHYLTHGMIRQHSELVALYPGESWESYQRRVAAGLQNSYRILSDHGVSTRHFAAPFGHFNQTVKELAYEVGYKYLWGTDPFPVMSGYQSLNRIDVGAYWTNAGQLYQRIIDTSGKVPPY